MIPRKMRIAVVLELLIGFLVCGCGKEDRLAKAQWNTERVELSQTNYVDFKWRAVSGDDVTSRNWTALHQGGARKPWEKYELEIAAGKKALMWTGTGMPISMRKFEDVIYLIAFERFADGPENAKFRYYKQKDANFVEIAGSDYPKKMAIQNLNFVPGLLLCNGKRVSHYDIASGMDTSDPCFQTSLTAYIWNHLENEVQYTASLREWTMGKGFLDAYIDKYQPEKLSVVKPVVAP